MNLTEQFLDFALLGANWVLWLLVLLSVASFAIIIERLILYSGVRGKDAALIRPLHEAMRGGRNPLEQLRKLTHQAQGPGARTIAVVAEAGELGLAAATSLIDSQRPQERLRLDRNLSFLGTVGANAPFIGLFGTVLEILKVFNLLGSKGVTSGSEAAGIMTGISEALVATAVGLLVAIPAVIAYNALQRRVKRLIGDGDRLSNLFLAELAEFERRGQPPATKPASAPRGAESDRTPGERD